MLPVKNNAHLLRLIGYREHVEFEKNKTAGRRLANLAKTGAWSSIPG